MTAIEFPRWKVTKGQRGWKVTGPAGREFPGFPSQRSAFIFARSLAVLQPTLTTAVGSWC